MYCVDVTVPDDIARRRLLESGSERLMERGHITPGETLKPGCARHEGNVVERFEPLDDQ